MLALVGLRSPGHGLNQPPFGRCLSVVPFGMSGWCGIVGRSNRDELAKAPDVWVSVADPTIRKLWVKLRIDAGFCRTFVSPLTSNGSVLIAAEGVILQGIRYTVEWSTK
jgi:hypothetical protein